MATQQTEKQIVDLAVKTLIREMKAGISLASEGMDEDTLTQEFTPKMAEKITDLFRALQKMSFQVSELWNTVANSDLNGIPVADIVRQTEMNRAHPEWRELQDILGTLGNLTSDAKRAMFKIAAHARTSAEGNASPVTEAKRMLEILARNKLI
jgi:hypothetical protein